MTNSNLRVINRPVVARQPHFRSNTRRVQRLDLSAAPRDEGRRRQRNALACGRCRQRKIKCEGDEGNGCQACRNAGPAKCNYFRVHSGDIHEIEVLSPTSTASPNQWNLAIGGSSDRSASMVPMRSDPSQYSISNTGQPTQFPPNALLYSNDQAHYNGLEDAGYDARRLSSRLVPSSRGSVNQTGNAGLGPLANSSPTMSEGLTSWTPQNHFPTYLADSSSYYPGMSPAIRHLPQPSSAGSFGPRNSIASLNGLPRQQEQFPYDENYDLGKLLPEGGHLSVDTAAARDTPYSSPRDHRSSSLHNTAAQDEAITRANRAGTFLAPAREIQQAYDIEPSSTYMTTSNQSTPYTRFPNANLGWEFWNPRNTPVNEGQDGGRGTHRQEHRQFRNIQARPRRADSSEGNPS